MRPPAPTKIECQHGRGLRSDIVWAPNLCLCCGNEHRSAGNICLWCRPSGVVRG